MCDSSRFVGEIQYTVEDLVMDGEVTGSIIHERCSISTPWVLQSFMNKTISALHPQILQNVQYILDGS